MPTRRKKFLRPKKLDYSCSLQGVAVSRGAWVHIEGALPITVPDGDYIVRAVAPATRNLKKDIVIGLMANGSYSNFWLDTLIVPETKVTRLDKLVIDNPFAERDPKYRWEDVWLGPGPDPGLAEKKALKKLSRGKPVPLKQRKAYLKALKALEDEM